MKRYKIITALTACSSFLIFLLFQNSTLLGSNLPDFPLRNVDTRTVKMTDGFYQTTNPHMPVHDMTADGRIGILPRFLPNDLAEIALIQPENVIDHINNRLNPLSGANLIKRTANKTFDMKLFRQKFPILNNRFKHERIFPCERTEQRSNPRVCDGNKDCYEVILITRFGTDESLPQEDSELYFTSVKATIKVQNPKTRSAFIESINVHPTTFRIGPKIQISKLVEPLTVGDNRLLIARASGTTMLTTNSSETPASDVDIVYSTYPVLNSDGSRTLQCDVTQWRYSQTDVNLNRMHPIAHAPYDSRNRMPQRYKFARYPFRDGLGQLIPGNRDLGGSYPWMDKDAANLVFTSFGRDPFYRFDSGVKSTVYAESNASGYFTPSNLDQRKDVEHGDRTSGIAILGFWTHGKAVLLDGLLNSSDYTFRIAPSTEGSNANIDVHRKIKLYQNTPPNQVFESVGAVRERGNDVDKNKYHPLLTLNSSYMGSMENRLNYVEALKTVTPRDVVWHFGSSRHTDEVIFDDYMTPYALIFAEMTAAIGSWAPGSQTMRHYDGLFQGTLHPISSVSGFPNVPNGNPTLFQNAATATDTFLKVPGYGKPVGDVRIEPIAKGGIYGKGAWLVGNSGITFKVPVQGTTSFSANSQFGWYVSTFLDARYTYPTGNTYIERQLIAMSPDTKIILARQGTSDKVFNKVILKKGSTEIGSIALNGALRISNNKWYHIGIQFKSPAHELYMNGYLLGTITKNSSVLDADYRNFFRPADDKEISLGSHSNSQDIAIRGWYDEFRVMARIPTAEEKCNYARGTLVNVPATAALNTTALRYPESSHLEIRNLVGGAGNFACFVRYGEVAYSELNDVNYYAHLKNIPSDVVSVREKALLRNKILEFNRERPDYSKNHFCLSCHEPQSSSSSHVTHAELDVRALSFRTNVLAQNDPRRQPQQPPRWIRGVIPANYFGPGKPSATLAQPGVRYEVDQWILPTSGLSSVGTPEPAAISMILSDSSDCEQSMFNYQNIAYEQSCGCTNAPDSYAVNEVGSRGQSCVHRAVGTESGSCYRRQFLWEGARYEKACGCQQFGEGFYNTSEIGPNGQSCRHRMISPAN